MVTVIWGSRNVGRSGAGYIKVDVFDFFFQAEGGIRDAQESRGLGDVYKEQEGRWRAYSHGDIVARDKASLDILWLKDDSLADSDNLPPPEVIAQEIVEDLLAALEQFKLIAGDLGAEVTEPA
mgnify:CR=1 FL=1